MLSYLSFFKCMLFVYYFVMFKRLFIFGCFGLWGRLNGDDVLLLVYDGFLILFILL